MLLNKLRACCSAFARYVQFARRWKARCCCSRALQLFRCLYCLFQRKMLVFRLDLVRDLSYSTSDAGSRRLQADTYDVMGHVLWTSRCCCCCCCISARRALTCTSKLQRLQRLIIKYRVWLGLQWYATGVLCWLHLHSASAFAAVCTRTMCHSGSGKSGQQSASDHKHKL